MVIEYDVIFVVFILRMLRIAWTDKVTNEEVLRRAGLKRELMRSIEMRQLQFLCRILKAQGLESECLLAMINGKRAKGRQRKKYIHSFFFTSFWRVTLQHCWFSRGPPLKEKQYIYIQLKYSDYNTTKKNGKNITKVIFLHYKKK